jgi:hypothetical protein
MGRMYCNPEKSKPCGAACIQKSFTCRKTAKQQHKEPHKRQEQHRSSRKCNPMKSKPCGAACIQKSFNCKKSTPSSKPKSHQKQAWSRPQRAWSPPANDIPKTKQTLKTCTQEARDLKELPFNATLAEGRRAWIKASRACHPDKGGTNEEQQCVNFHWDSFKAKRSGYPLEQVGDRPSGCEVSIFNANGECY